MVLLRLLIAFLLAVASNDAGATTGATLTLDADGSYLLVEPAPALNPTGGITIEAWIRPTSFNDFPTIVGKDYTSSYWLGLTSVGRLRYYTRGTFSSRDGVQAVPLGQWTHVAVSFDGTTRRYYIDGALDFEQATPGSLPINFEPLGIGADSNGAFDFEGNLAEVRIWSIARTQQEIRNDLARQIDRDEPGLVAAWNLDGSELELLARFETARVGTARFTGQQAPPEPFFPLRIPRLGSASNPNGFCGAGEYGPLRLPIWYDATSRPAWVYVGATQLTLHFCFDELNRAGHAGQSVASVQVDRNASGGTVPQATDDLRAGLQEDGTEIVQTGSGSGGWASSGLGSFVEVATEVSQEFTWDAEISLSRLLFTATPDSVFNLSLVHRDAIVLLDSFGWPQDAAFATPDSWDSAYFDDTNLPRADSSNPTTTLDVARAGAVAGGERPMRFAVRAYDDVDLATIEIYVDNVLEEICDIDGTNDTVNSCGLMLALPLGMHNAYAVARDHRGRVGATPARGFRVEADGEAPVVTLEHAPVAPPVGNSTHVTAHATDPTGVTRIEISLDTVPYTTICSFAPAVTDAVCAVDVPLTTARPWFHYRASAEDVEDYTTRIGPRTVVADDAGLDSDQDGIPNVLEDTLCTSRFTADTDEDGLSDGWEIRGLQVPGGGIVDLPALGADPCRKDVFLQYDYEVGARVEPGVIEDMAAAMRAQGIALHVEENERPRPPADPVSAIGAVEAAYQEDGEGNSWFPPERNWTHFYAYSRHRVGRSGAWGRYFTFDIYGYFDDCVCPLDSADPNACRDGANRCYREDRDGQSRRFLHELGHSMGLGHGGQTGVRSLARVGEYLYYAGLAWDSDNHKPNHVSVMNYGYNGGLYCANPAPAGRRTGVDLVAKLTYSEANLGNLNESALDERPTSSFANALRAQSCAHATAGALPTARHTCFDARETATGTDAEARVFVLTDGTNPVGRVVAFSDWTFPDPATQPDGIDWDCDGTIEASSSDNINGDNADYPLPGEVCNGADDNANGFVDEGCSWGGGQTLNGVEEWSRIPRPPDCIELYLAAPQNCYPQPSAYRDGIAANDTLLDCRVRYAPGGANADCPDLPILFDAPYTPIQQPEEAFAPELPDVEFCDEDDNDGDREVDEGCRDTDLDGVSDVIDNCPRTPNANQLDADADFVGDACERPAQLGDVATQDTPNGRVVSWKPPGGDVARVRVYRESIAGGSLDFLGDTGSSSFTDTSANPGESVRYRVIPLGPLGDEVIESTAVIAAPAPSAGLLGVAAATTLALLRRRRNAA